MFVGSWAGNFLFNNAKDAPQAVAQVSERVAKVEVNDKNQDETISEMKDDVKHIRGLMDQWAQKQGITIKTQ